MEYKQLFISTFFFIFIYFCRLIDTEIVFNPFLYKDFILQDYISKKALITPKSFRYFLENDLENLLLNYKKLIPNKRKVQYHTLVPFHSNGIYKKKIDYRDFFSLNNINIYHFSSFINGQDNYSKKKEHFLILPSNPHSRVTIYLDNFTLIYGITVCKPTPHLIREIIALSHKNVAFIIFYDNKANRTALYQLFSTEINNKLFENVYFINSPRFYVGWGEITQAFTQLVICIAALKYFPNSKYLSFHSESDYPLVPNDYIINILNSKYPNNYMEIIPPKKEGAKKKRKDVFKFFFEDKNNKKIIKMIYYLFPKKVIPYAKYRSGANWFTLTINDIKKIIDKLHERFDLVDNLEYCICVDEVILPTLAIEANVTCIKPYLRYISWKGSGKKPIVFSEDRFDELVAPRCAFWARKFSFEKSSKVLDMIDKHIQSFNYNISDYCE